MCAIVHTVQCTDFPFSISWMERVYWKFLVHCASTIRARAGGAIANAVLFRQNPLMHIKIEFIERSSLSWKWAQSSASLYIFCMHTCIETCRTRCLALPCRAYRVQVQTSLVCKRHLTHQSRRAHKLCRFVNASVHRRQVRCDIWMIWNFSLSLRHSCVICPDFRFSLARACFRIDRHLHISLIVRLFYWPCVVSSSR